MLEHDTGPVPERESARIRLDVAYDGTEFSGWAIQPARRTVAGEITAVLQRIFQTEVSLTVAGRTDAGVHATGQVCHVDVPAERWESLKDTLVRRMAGLLPLDVRISRAVRTSPDFDARFSALWRRYEYRVTDDPAGASPLRRLDTLAWPRQLDLARLNEAAAGLRGEHDFAAFCRRKEMATTIREVTRLDWRHEEPNLFVATVQADAFCQQMVRSLVGAMLAVGEGRRPAQWPASLLHLTERSSDVPVAGAHGLTLVAVGYPEEAAFAERAGATRQLRTRRS
ncbi:tRNA pseudouridine(38-40) synthase TruA [Catelliglobosispora koreensis]|uniref:tRNA pseudouridine(38-40) synthase TruA n=1 Tax=Catelliglobosispora koreensis TaxID=129052 RepID=UPI000371CFA6|nr:tRNA pseudouridine(38-40) synthase TruA [Catelliglobosispora koreensis]